MGEQASYGEPEDPRNARKMVKTELLVLFRGRRGYTVGIQKINKHKEYDLQKEKTRFGGGARKEELSTSITLVS